MDSRTSNQKISIGILRDAWVSFMVYGSLLVLRAAIQPSGGHIINIQCSHRLCNRCIQMMNKAVKTVKVKLMSLFLYHYLTIYLYSIPSQFLKKYCDFPRTDLYEIIQSCEPLPIVRDIRPRVLLGFGMGMGIGRIGCMSITQPSHSRPWWLET